MTKEKLSILGSNHIGSLRSPIIFTPEFSLCCVKKIIEGLEETALRHSSDMEIDTISKTTGEIRRVEKESFEDLKKAYQWANNVYKGTLSEWLIKGIAFLVEPLCYRTSINRKLSEFKKPGYRTKMVTIRNATWNPPSPEKIPGMMEEFIIENKRLENIVERAVHAHFNILRIHPFEDGNGRTARLVQDVMLKYEGYPPILIKKSEKMTYDDLVDNAVTSLKFEKKLMTPELFNFYNFLRKKLVKEIEKYEIKKRTCYISHK